MCLRTPLTNGQQNILIYDTLQKKNAILVPTDLSVRSWTFGKAFQFAVALQAMRADGEVTRMFLCKAFLGTGSNSRVYRLHLLDVPCCNSRTSEHAYAFLAHEQKNLACILNVRTVMLWLGLPLKPLSSNGLPF